MRWLRDLSIRWKLILIAVLTCIAAELFAGIVLTYYSSDQYLHQKYEDVDIQVDVLGASLAAPLAFGDISAARQYLDALKADRAIAAAGVYSVKGTLFASYTRAESPAGLLPPKSPSPGRRYAQGTLTMSKAVVQEGNELGRIYLVVDVDPVATRFLRFGSLVLLAMLGSLVISVPLSMRLNASISDSIREIARAASRVTEGDLNVELPSATSKDEVGILVSTFGKMVASLRDLMQHERLRALGQMSSGIAHDINNALSPMALMTQSLLEREKNLDPHIRNYMETVQRVVGDVSATVGRMRDFSRKREAEIVLAPVDLNLMILQVVDLTRARWSDIQQTLGSVIDIKTELDKQLPAIMGIEGEIREALTNLIFNAIDAMPEGGTITLRTRSTLDAGVCHAEVDISDTGAGMDEDTKRRCFEPFFTTKGERGTGLGLAMVYGMVQRHSAAVAIDSMPGIGTTVRLRFLARTPVIPQAQFDKMDKRADTVCKRILLIDDDPFVLSSMELVLNLDGHDVVTAEGGQNGIDQFRQALTDDNPFDVVITDLGMPYIDGRQVARTVKSLSSSTQVILLTGWGQRMTASGDMPEGVDHLLGKPPKLEELRETLAIG